MLNFLMFRVSTALFWALHICCCTLYRVSLKDRLAVFWWQLASQKTNRGTFYRFLMAVRVFI